MTVEDKNKLLKEAQAYINSQIYKVAKEIGYQRMLGIHNNGYVYKMFYNLRIILILEKLTHTFIYVLVSVSLKNWLIVNLYFMILTGLRRNTNACVCCK